MHSMSSKEKETILELIRAYKEMPCLWDKTHEDYKNKVIRNKNLDVLVDVFREFEPSATRRLVSKKIQNLRTNYSRELKKIIGSVQSEDEERYVPNLFYFDALSFLYESYIALYDSRDNSISHISTTSKVESPVQREAENDSPVSSYLRKPETRYELPAKRPYLGHTSNTVSTSVRSDSTSKNNPNVKDDAALFGEYIAEKIRHMSAISKAKVQHRINTVIYEIEMEDLNADLPVFVDSRSGYESKDGIIEQETLEYLDEDTDSDMTD